MSVAVIWMERGLEDLVARVFERNWFPYASSLITHVVMLLEVMQLFRGNMQVLFSSGVTLYASQAKRRTPQQLRDMIVASRAHSLCEDF